MEENKADKIIYFVRHGQSEGNVSPAFQGSGSSLSALGKKQAEQIAERAKQLDFSKIISSPFQRAKETALVIKEVTGKNLEFNDLFVERRKPSSIQEKSIFDEAARAIAKEWADSLYSSGKKVEDGENFDELKSRAIQAFKYLEECSEKELLVVTHGYFLKVMFAIILLGEDMKGEDFRHFAGRAHMENTGVTVYSFDKSQKKWWVWIWNDSAHLD